MKLVRGNAIMCREEKKKKKKKKESLLSIQGAEFTENIEKLLDNCCSLPDKHIVKLWPHPHPHR